MSKLDQDFEEVAQKINHKVKEAADALKEANRLAGEAGLPALIVTQWNEDEFLSAFGKSDEDEGDEEVDEDYDEMDHLDEIRSKMEQINVGPLESALARGGWSTSSSYC